MIIVGIIPFHPACAVMASQLPEVCELPSHYHRMYSYHLSDYELRTLSPGILFLQFPVVNDANIDALKYGVKGNLPIVDLWVCMQSGEKSLTDPYHLDLVQMIHDHSITDQVPVLCTTQQMSDVYHHYCERLLSCISSTIGNDLFMTERVVEPIDISKYIHEIIYQRCGIMAQNNYRRCVEKLGEKLHSPHGVIVWIQTVLACVRISQYEGLVIDVGNFWLEASQKMEWVSRSVGDAEREHYRIVMDNILMSVSQDNMCDSCVIVC